VADPPPEPSECQEVLLDGAFLGDLVKASAELKRARTAELRKAPPG
jgi:hypothetical protein